MAKEVTTEMPNLLTDKQREQLRSNFDARVKKQVDGGDFVPVVRLFNAHGAGTWMLTELAGDNDRAMGLCDLGVGFPEYGEVRLSELEQRIPYRFWVERDHQFKANKSVLEFMTEAQRTGAL